MTDPATAPGRRISDQIRERMHELTPSERRVALALLAGSPTIGLESSSRLARRAGVSGPTVSRFVQRLGFENYAAVLGDSAAQVDVPDVGLAARGLGVHHHARVRLGRAGATAPNGRYRDE